MGSDGHNPDPGTPRVSDEILEVYEQLREVARSYMTPSSETIQPTALVHEAYLRLANRNGDTFRDDTHFVCTAAKAMRHVLVDHARARRTEKRGGGWSRVTLSGLSDEGPMDFDALDISEALEILEGLAPRQARLVELRFFAGMRDEEIAAVLGVSDRTIRTDWRLARAWLRAELIDRAREGDRA